MSQHFANPRKEEGEVYLQSKPRRGKWERDTWVETRGSARRQCRTSDGCRSSGRSRGSGRPEGVELLTFLLWTGVVGFPVAVGRPGAVVCQTSGVTSVIRPL
jgi:hypothetical protein